MSVTEDPVSGSGYCLFGGNSFLFVLLLFCDSLVCAYIQNAHGSMEVLYVSYATCMLPYRFKSEQMPTLF